MSDVKSGVEKGTLRQTDIERVRLLKLTALTADPVDAENGDIWYRSDTDQLKAKLNGAVVVITTV